MDNNLEPSHIDVLIVEDEIDICYLLSGILKKKNLQTAYVTNLLEAHKALDLKKPNILFLDNHLPDGFGVDFIHSVKKEHPLTRIVMITAHDTDADKEKAMQEGADFFIGKPFTRETINSTIDTLINNFHSTER